MLKLFTILLISSIYQTCLADDYVTTIVESTESQSSQESNAESSSSSSSHASYTSSSTDCGPPVTPPPKCTKANEVWDPCPAKCPPRTCGIDETLIDCAPSPSPGDPDCPSPACRCQNQFFRDDKGNCVPWKKCPTCKNPNEVYDPCDAPCPGRRCDVDLTVIKCGKPPQLGSPDCVVGCRCIDGYVRDSKGLCIPSDKCPPKTPICGPNEVYDKCPDCSPQTCETMNATYSCPAIPANKTGLNCKPSCRCQPGYFRNKIGECIAACDCLKCTKPNEYFSCGGACDNVCDTIKEQNQTNCPIINVKCNPMCYCERDYARDYKGDCIPIKQCPVCPANEKYDPCPATLCGPKTCDEAGFPRNCTQRQDGDPCPGKPGCVCRDGYLRNKKGICIPTDQCPSCGGDKNATNGCGVNCNRHCRNLNQTEPEMCILICYSNACDCRTDKNGNLYYYDDVTKKCVLPQDCTKCTKPNEVYDPCDAPCPGRSCDVDPAVVRCKAPPKVGDKECVVGCRCIDGYARNEQGNCIPREKCPPKQPDCGPNEVYDTCPDCSLQTCETMNATYHCPLIPANRTGPNCKPSCRCKRGYFRNKIGECIAASDCQKCTKPHEYFSCGGACDNVCDTIKEQNQTSCPIINIVCNRMCYCEKDFARDYKGDCIPIKDCPTCPKNEKYDPCPATLCGPKTCDEAGFPNDCPPRDDGTPCPGEPGCICRDGYLRNKKGRCIPSDQCPSCGGDYNATYGCGVNCNRRCSDLGQSEPQGCIQICYPNSCDCRTDKDGNQYYYDDNTKKCVLPKDCTPQCKENEVFSDCVNGGCGKQNCTDINEPVVCIYPKTCKTGCICAPGYLRAKNGTCVPSEKCDPPPKCKVNEEFSKCGRDGCLKYYCSDLDLPPLCSDTFQCIPQCECKEGYLRASVNNNTCVLVNQCPRKCNDNEYYSDCPFYSCQPKTCKQAGYPIPCLEATPDGECPGGPGCVCNYGYLKNDKGICVPQDQCPPTCKVNEVFSNCTNGVCRPQNCTDIDKNLPCPAISEGSCKPGCVCQEDYYRASNGTCVPPDQCDQTCPDGEVLSKCPPIKCDGEYCPQSRDDPQTCPTPKKCGPPRCVCGFNSHRDRKTGNCIATFTCPPFPCDGPNESYDSCPPVCPGENCLDYLKNSTCPRFRIGIVVPCKPACRCDKGYYRNYNGICVSSCKCQNQACKPNEEFSTCTNGICRPQNCLEKDMVVPCPAIEEGSCNAGCVCKENYLRNKNGDCVPEDECDDDNCHD